jgi:hypothetical protein
MAIEQHTQNENAEEAGAVCLICEGTGLVDSDRYEDNYNPVTGDVLRSGGVISCICRRWTEGNTK